jgi:DNA (cytosine-5)-methyltransferase 1
MYKHPKPTVVSLFVGCGGLDVGFKEEGFDLIYSCDNDPEAIRTYKRNVDERAYIRDVTSEEFRSDIKDIGECDVVLGGFPCQGFSKAGPKQENDSRNLLYLEMKSAIEVLKPKIFIAENVDGLSQNFKGRFLEQITSDFEKVGYSVKYKILDAVNFGVPQHRRRIFFIGTKIEDKAIEFKWPTQTHNSNDRNGESALNRMPDLLDSIEFEYQRNAVTIREAIYDLKELDDSIPDHRVTNKWKEDYSLIMEQIQEGQKLCNVRFSDTSVYTWNIPEVFGNVDHKDILVLETIGKNRRHKKYGSIPNGNPLPEITISELSGLTSITKILTSLVKRGYLKEKGNGYDLTGAMFCSGLFKRPKWDAPSPTILTNFHNPRYFVHPERNTPFSLRECARLQGFRDDFIFTTTNSSKELEAGYRLVGNAVAPPIARAFAATTINLIARMTKNKDETTSDRIISTTTA